MEDFVTFFGDYLSQIPPGFYLIVFGVPIALLALLSIMRSRRKAQPPKNLITDNPTGNPVPPSQHNPEYTGEMMMPSPSIPPNNPDDEMDALELLAQARAEAKQGQPSGEDDQPSGVHRLAEQPVAVQLFDGQLTQAQEVLSILRDERDGRLLVQMSDGAYRTFADDPDRRKQFTRLMKELSSVILKPDDLQAPPEPAQPEEAPPAPTAPAAPGPVDELASPSRQSAPEESAAMPGDLPKMRIEDNPGSYERGRFGRVKVKKVEKAPQVNIAEAIEAYLQHKIGSTPQFQQRGIHIRSALHGGVRIEADGKNYDFVDEVDDPAVRQFLQETIAEWQQRQG